MKLDLICSKDELRPQMNCVKVTRDECVATDAHALGVINTKEFFGEGFTARIPENGFLIHREDWKKFNGCHLIEWVDEEKLILQAHFNNKRPALIQATTEDKEGKYPNWKGIIPEKGGELAEFAINPSILLNLCKALNIDCCRLVVSGGENKAFRVEDNNNLGTAYGIVMPVMISR